MTQDTRIAYGARCTWWDSIDKVGHTEPKVSALRRPDRKPVTTVRVTLPCCPHCGGVLHEAPNIELWNASIENFARKSNDPEYIALMAWARGRCFHNVLDMRAAYARHKLLQVYEGRTIPPHVAEPPIEVVPVAAEPGEADQWKRIRAVIDKGRLWVEGAGADSYNVAADQVAQEIAALASVPAPAGDDVREALKQIIAKDRSGPELYEQRPDGVYQCIGNADGECAMIARSALAALASPQVQPEPDLVGRLTALANELSWSPKTRDIAARIREALRQKPAAVDNKPVGE